MHVAVSDGAPLLAADYGSSLSIVIGFVSGGLSLDAALAYLVTDCSPQSLSGSLKDPTRIAAIGKDCLVRRRVPATAYQSNTFCQQVLCDTAALAGATVSVASLHIYKRCFSALMFPLRFDDNSIKLFNFNLRLMAVIVYVDRLSHTEREVAAPEVGLCCRSSCWIKNVCRTRIVRDKDIKNNPKATMRVKLDKLCTLETEKLCIESCTTNPKYCIN
uniref:Uncharacterized protein n=1 Tax=Glossina austeni TaxID=7395 RepID=A0A1A9VY75_GLOAU